MLIDISSAQSLGITFNDAHEVSQFAAQRFFMMEGKTAIIAGSDEAYGLGRMHEILSGLVGREVRVFRSRSEAEELLGIRPD